MALQLFLNGAPVDLPTDAADQVRINGAANDVSKLDSRINERSYPLTLPPTRRNDTFFKAARAHLTPSKWGLGELPARLIAAGADVLDAGAVCRLQGAGPQGYEVLLYSAGVPLGEALAAKNLRDLSLATRAYTGVSDLEALIAGDSETEILAAPLISYGNFFAPPMLSTPPLNYIDSPLLLDDYVLSAWCAPVLRAIFAEAGYRIEGAPLQDPRWLKALMPYTSADAFPWNWGLLGEGTAVVYRTTPGSNSFTGDICELLSVPDGITYPGPNPVPTNHFQAIQYVAPEAGTLQVAGTWRYSGDGLSVGATLYAVVTTPSGETAATLIATATSNNAPGSFYNQAVSHTVLIPEPGSVVLILPQNSTTGSAVVYRWDELHMAFDMVSGADEIAIAKVLPDLDCKAFVAAFLTLFNADFTIDMAGGVVRFYYRDTLNLKEAEQAVSLDGVLDPATLRFRPAATFKQVAFEWQASGDAATPEGYGNAVVNVSAPGRTETKTITVPGFAATKNRDYVSLPPDPLYFGTYDLSLPTLSDQQHLDQLRTEADWSYDYTPRLLLFTGVTTGTNQIQIGTRPDPPVWVNFGLASMLGDGDGALVFGGGDGLVKARYAETLEVLRASDLATGELPLTPALYRQLTPGRIVKLAGQLYRVNQVTGYRPGLPGSKASIELLRYVAPSGRG